MSLRHALLIPVLSLGVGLTAFSAQAQMTMKSPTDVQKALGTLNRVVDHTGRLIAAKNYAQLPHENDEFKEGSQALSQSIAAEPADFKGKIQPLIERANTESQNLSSAAAAKDDDKLNTTHTAFANAVKVILAAFPASVQPPPPSVEQEKKEEHGR